MLKMKNPLQTILLFLRSVDVQDQDIRHMVYPIQNGLLCCIVCLRRRNLFAKLRMSMVCLVKQSGASFLLLKRREQAKELLLRHLQDSLMQILFSA
ncbi:MAG TPA: hypothetical protein DEV72_14340 [Ktedonobacter sp.]|nr:hypothetical protein [Ktedonobacter sp.]HCF86368.1 hypothetical protein [Ktedonobacter sp.]